MTTGSEPQRIPEADATRLLGEIRLEADIRLLKRSGCEIGSAAAKALILGYEIRANQMHRPQEQTYRTGEARAYLV